MKKPPLPPGPRGALLNTLSYAWNPWAVLRRARERYGDPFTVPTLFGPVVVTGCAEGAREIFSAPEDTFAGFGMESVGAILGPTSLMLAGGANHRRMRKLHAPAFRSARVRLFDGHIVAAIERVMASWRPGHGLCAIEASREISLEVIVRAVFGGTDEATAAEVRAVLREMVDSISPWLLFFPVLQQGRVARWSRYRRAVTALERVIREQCDRRRREPGGDVLSMLLAATDDEGHSMTDVELRDQLVTLLLAGYDTSAFSLAWALYYVHHHRDIRARLLDELSGLPASAEADDVARLPYLDAVCQEALRIHPLGSDILRTAVRPFSLRGHELPAGTGVALSATLLHEDPEVFPEAHHFDPERFLRRSYSAFEYVPYGGGAFRCVGAALATREMKLAVASIVRRAELSLVSARPVRPVRKHFLTGPAAPIEMRVLRLDQGPWLAPPASVTPS